VLPCNDGFKSVRDKVPKLAGRPDIPLHTNASENDLRA
jgi:hypothetical protein